MRSPRLAVLAAVCVVFLMVGCSGSTPRQAASPGQREGTAKARASSPVEVMITAPDEQTKVALRVVLPAGWEVNPDFGTLVYEPANRLDLLEAPSVEIRAAAEGEMRAEAISGNIDRDFAKKKEGWKKISTGNADLDAKGANVEIVEESTAAGQWFLALKVTYPEGVSAAMYPPRYYIYRYLHQANEPFFVLVSGKVPLAEAARFLGPVTEACRSAERL